jgi:hypothetical protein
MPMVQPQACRYLRGRDLRAQSQMPASISLCFWRITKILCPKDEAGIDAGLVILNEFAANSNAYSGC